MFINVSNHSSSGWDSNQTEAAENYGGGIVDMNFPQIGPRASSQEIDDAVAEYLSRIQQYTSPVVMIQGEFVFTFRLVTALKKNGIKAVAATTERISDEIAQPDGSVMKKSVYKFVQFREY